MSKKHLQWVVYGVIGYVAFTLYSNSMNKGTSNTGFDPNLGAGSTGGFEI